MEPEMKSGVRTSTIVLVLGAVLVLLGGWYWLSGTQSANAPAAPSQTESITAPNTIKEKAADFAFIVSSDAKLGQYLASPSGMTLYTYSKDAKGVSNCSGTCATNWPPYTIPTGAAPSVPAGITGSIGSITRTDGTLQLTYNGMPLYLWVQDTKAGDITGDNVGGFLLAKP
jgi:predicted lipoprotein with Yx(FWY)xxD motif